MSHKNIKQEHEPQFKCPFPGCTRTFVKKEKETQACGYHKQFVSDWLFCNNNIRIANNNTPEVTDSGLVIPKPGESIAKLTRL